MDSNQSNGKHLRGFLLGSYGECCDQFFQTVEQAKEFNTGLNENDYAGMSLDDYRRIQNRRAQVLAEYSFIENANVIETPVCPAAFCDAMSFIEWSAAMKYFLNRSVCRFIHSNAFIHSIAFVMYVIYPAIEVPSLRLDFFIQNNFS